MSVNRDLNEINQNENTDFDNLDNEKISSYQDNTDKKVTNSILTESSVERQFREFENSLTDPYLSVQNFAQSQREKFNNNYSESSIDPNRLNTNPTIRVSDRAASLFNYAARSVVESSLDVVRRQELKSLNSGYHLIGYTSNESGSIYKGSSGESSMQPGLINRPGVSEYNNLFSDSYGSLSATFFQLQNKEVISSLLQRQNETKLVTQGLIPSSSGNSNQILANNEITAQLANLPGNVLNITRAYSDSESSIHPKMGYNNRYAFIGTQNLTNALNKYNTQENLLVVKRSSNTELVTAYSGFKEVSQILQANISNSRNAVYSLNKSALYQANLFAQNIIADQIVAAQNSLLSTINENSNSIVTQTGYASSLAKTLNTLNSNKGVNLGTYVFTSSDIFNRLKSVIDKASNFSKTDKVVISGKELSILFNSSSNNLYSPEVHNFRENILSLAKAGRLTILTDSNYLDKLHNQNISNSNSESGLDETGRVLLNTLSEKNQIRTIALGMNHEKSTMVFGGSVQDAGQLKFLSTGSANYSNRGMLDNTKNVELMLAIGVDSYQHDSRSVIERTVGSIMLSNLNNESDNSNTIYKRYETLSGLNFSNNKTTHSSTRIIEQNASSKGVSNLKSEIQSLNSRLGGDLIEVSNRFDNKGNLVGLRTIVKPLNSSIDNQVIINLSVNREGNIVLSDLNKIISGSAFINNSTNNKIINGQTIKAGETVQMDSVKTAIGLLATITRELSNQSRYQLVDITFNELVKTGYTDIFKTSASYLNLLTPNLVQNLGEGDLNLDTIRNAIKTKYGSNKSQLATDIHNISLKIASGEISPFNNASIKDGGFVDEIKSNSVAFNKRYSAMQSLFTSLTTGTEFELITGLESFAAVLDNDPDRLFADVRLQSILDSDEGRKRYSKAFNSLSSSLVNLITSPFLALHEQTYGAYQAPARTPVYGEGDLPVDSTIINRLRNEGFLNPQAVSHSTKIGTPGEFYRAINHTASANYLKLPAYGGLNQVKLTDSDLHEGAVAIYNNEKLFSSLNNHGFINREEYKANLEYITGKTVEDEKLDTIFGNSRIIFNYAFPEKKLEQLQQRIKNTTGARVDLDINTELVRNIKSVRSVDIDTYRSNGNLLTGNIKSSLPRAQSQKVQQYINEFTQENNRAPSKLEITNYFRELEFDRSLTERGVIGEENYKRVAINAGFSNMGDYIYGNADALPETGYLRLLKIKIDPKNINNLEDTQNKLSLAFRQGNIIYNEPQSVSEHPSIKKIESLNRDITSLKRLINFEQNNYNEGYINYKITSNNVIYERTSEALDRINSLKINVLTLEQQVKQELKINSLIVRSTGSKNDYQLDKGLYSFDDQGKPVQLGRFEREGIITLNNINITDSEGRHSVVSFKVGSSKDKGYSIFTQDASIIAATDRKTLTIEASELVIKNPSSGVRLVGVKGPVLYMDSTLFSSMEAHLENKDRQISASGRVSLNTNLDTKIYSINTFSQFKEFSYESGIKLLTIDSIKDSLTGKSNIKNIDGFQLAENLSLLFIEKDDNGLIRTALKDRLSNTGRRQVAQAIDNIGGNDFSEVANGKPKYNLGIIANGLTMLADSSSDSYSKNVIEGNLSEVKQLVLKALQEGPDGINARNTLLNQTKSLINAAYEKGSIYSGSEFISFNDYSPIVKGAGLLAHINFIGSQLLNNSFTQGKSNLKSNLYEIKVDNVNKYLSDNVYKQKVDFVASTAGLSLTEFNKEDKSQIDINKLKSKLTFLQKQLDSGVIIEDIKSITTSSSLVAAGTNNETAFEYQNLAGASISYLNRYRRQHKIRDEGTLIRSKESQTIRTAYSIILAASLNDDQVDETNRSIPSLNSEDLISYRSVLHKPSFISDERGWHNSKTNNINNLITNYTPIANKLGLLQDSIQSGNLDRYNSVGYLNTVAVGINNDPAVVNRAVSISEITGKFRYYSDITGNQASINAGIIQRDKLHQSLLNNSYDTNISSLDLVSKLINNQYTEYLNKLNVIKVNRHSVPDIMLDTFSEYVSKQNGLFSNEIYNQQLIGTIKQLENSQGKLKDVNGSEEIREQQIRLAISQENARSEKLVEQSLYIDRVGRAKQYTDAMLSTHDHIQTRLNEVTNESEKASLTEYLNEVSKTKNLILPAFKAIAQPEGNFVLQFSNIESVSAHQGTLLGTDVIGKVPLVFPGHVEDVLINQIRLRKQIETIQPLLSHIRESVEQKLPVSINGEQLAQLHQMTDLMAQSIEGIKSLANTSFSQKVYGEGETFYGNNTIPVNSLGIASNEAVVGSKINNLVADNPVRQVIDSYFDSLIRNSESSFSDADKSRMQQDDINKLKTLYSSLGSKGEDLQKAVLYEQSLNQAYPQVDSYPLSVDQINNLRQRYTQAVTGMSLDEISTSNIDLVNQQYNNREVATRRGGAPAGIAASIADHFYNRSVNVSTYNKNIQNIGSELTVDSRRSYTAVILPTLSHLIAQQGDYDGDSFQLLMSNAGDLSNELLTIKNTQKRLLASINERQSVIDARATLSNINNYTSTSEEILSSIDLLKTQLNEENRKEINYLQSLTKSLSATKILESAELFHMKKWTAFNQAIPIGALDSLSAGTVISFSKFARTTIGNIEDGSDYSSKIYDKYERQLEAFTGIQKLYGANFDINSDHTDKTILEDYRMNLANSYDINVSTSDIDEAFTAIKSINPYALDRKNVSNSLLTYHAAQSSLSQALDGYIKHNEKAAGTLLNPNQIDLMQGLIGQAGTDLLGKSYNTLIPLLDQAMSDKGLQDILTLNLNKSNSEFSEKLYSNAEYLGIDKKDADILLNKLQDSSNIDRINTRSEATFAFLGSMQQVIRDALKDKSDRGLKSQLTSILETEYEDGKLVGDILKNSTGDLSYEEINKTRNLIFKHYVGSKLGSNLNLNIPNNTPDNIKQLFENARGNYVDSGVTGFGGLLMLRELALTNSEEDFKKRFIDTDTQLLDSFNKEVKAGTVNSAQEFATRHVLNLLQRTQASFADAMLGNAQRKEKVNALIEYGKKYSQDQIASVENPHAKAGLELMKAYGEFTDSEYYKTLPDSDRERLNTQFSQDVSLHTIRERQGLTVDDLYYLQASARENKLLQNQQVANQHSSSDSLYDPAIIFGSNINQEGNAVSVATIQRMLRRGHLSADQAQTLLLNRLTNIESAIGSQPHLSVQEQQQTALMLGFNTRADLNENERTLLSQTVAQMSSNLQHDSQSIQALYNTAEQFDDISKAIKLSTSETDLAELTQRRDHLKHLMNQYATDINSTKIQSTNDIGQTPHLLENILNTVSSETQLLGELHKISEPPNKKANRINLRYDPSLGALGALAVPLFLGAFKDGIKLDERALTLGYDMLQGTAHLATKQDRLITQLGELNSDNVQKRSQQTSANFQRSRISQNLVTEGALIGGLQSVAQETMFMSLTDLAYKGVDKLLARSGFENMKVGRGIGVVAAEVFTTIAAMSISRSMTKQRTQDNEYVPDFVGRMLQDFAQQIWLATQQAQMDRSRPEYEVIDTDENMNLDATTTGLISQAELDIATGFIDFDDETASIDSLSSSVPTYNNK